MIPEKVFQQILILGKSWEVFAVDYDEPQRKVFIRGRETPKLWAAECCPRCHGQSVAGYDHVPERHWRHWSVCQLESAMVCSLPRGRGRDGQAVFQVKPPWEGRSKHFPQEFEGFAWRLIRETPVSQAAEILGETDQRLWRMLFAHVEAAYAQLSLEEGVWIGADEMNRKKGHNDLTVFVDRLAKRVLLATPGKDASPWEAFATALAEHNGHPKAITPVAIDMSRADQKGVADHFGNATVSFDKFHVVSNVVEAVDQVRRAERAEADRGELLEKARGLFRKNPEHWTAKEGARWEALAGENLATGLAYQMRLVFQGIYQLGSAQLARKKFEDWCEWVEAAGAQAGQLLAPMVKVAGMVRQHLQGILGHWKAELTTAYLEGLNRLFSATKRKARGYRSTEHLITMLYFVAGKLSIPCY
jgi:transposase